MKKLLVGIIIGAFASCANALDIELSVGGTHFNPHGDGVWYQQAFPYQLKLNSPSASIGIAGDNWRLGYTYLGKYQSSALASASDADYEQYKQTGKHWPLSHWYGSGEVHGLYGSYLYKYQKMFVEVGGFVYVPSWVMTIPDYRWAEDSPTTYLQVRHKKTPTFTPVIGIGYAPTKSLSYALTVRRPNTKGDEWTSIANGWAATAEVRFKF